MIILSYEESSTALQTKVFKWSLATYRVDKNPFFFIVKPPSPLVRGNKNITFPPDKGARGFFLIYN